MSDQDVPLEPHPAHDPATVTICYAVNAIDGWVDVDAIHRAGAEVGSPVLLSTEDGAMWWRILDGAEAPVLRAPDDTDAAGWTRIGGPEQ